MPKGPHLQVCFSSSNVTLRYKGIDANSTWISASMTSKTNKHDREEYALL